MVTGDIAWFQVVCCFSSYTNFTTYRRAISLLYSWTHVADWGHSVFLFNIRQQKKKIVVLSPSRLKINNYFLYSIVLFPILLFPIHYSMSDKKFLLKEIWKKQSHSTKQVEYCELFETTSLNFFQKQGDYSYSRGDGGNWTKMGRFSRQMEKDGRSVK